jgi:hypothetical protein
MARAKTKSAPAADEVLTDIADYVLSRTNIGLRPNSHNFLRLPRGLPQDLAA